MLQKQKVIFIHLHLSHNNRRKPLFNVQCGHMKRKHAGDFSVSPFTHFQISVNTKKCLRLVDYQFYCKFMNVNQSSGAFSSFMPPYSSSPETIWDLFWSARGSHEQRGTDRIRTQSLCPFIGRGTSTMHSSNPISLIGAPESKSLPQSCNTLPANI